MEKEIENLTQEINDNADTIIELLKAIIARLDELCVK